MARELTAHIQREAIEQLAEAIETAKREGIPFTIYMADGRSVKVGAADQVVTRKGLGWIVLIPEDFVPRMIPLLTITTIE